MKLVAQIGTQNSQRPFRHSLGRALNHTNMKQACASFGGGVLKASVSKGLPRNELGNYPIPNVIQNFARTFVELQEKRHFADYDLSERFKRSEVLSLIDQARKHVVAFQVLPTSDDRKFFLACLWAWKELANR